MKHFQHYTAVAIAIGCLTACDTSTEEQNVGAASEQTSSVEPGGEPRAEVQALPVAEDFEESARDEITADNLEDKVKELEAEQFSSDS